MEPKNASPQMGPERSVGYVPASPEALPYPAFERMPEQSMEQRQSSEQSMPSLPPPVLPTISLPEPTVQQGAAQPVSAVSQSPLTANDDDLIEKEWVDKAKKIINETKDDPYLREKQVGDLQADYLMKRYGHDLGGSD